MLPPFIIEQIRKREEEEQARHEQPQPQLELPLPPPRREPKRDVDDEPHRGVIILDLMGPD